MKKIFLTFLLLITVLTSMQAGDKHYTVIVSLDGFRWDYPEMYSTPFLDSMAAHGVKAVMKPSFPSKTFPNHYTLATGLYPDHHGIVANSFWDEQTRRRYSLGDRSICDDPYFYGGEPIWITAQKQGVKTATVYWVGSDIPIQGQHPTYYECYTQTPRLTYAERVARVVELLRMPEEERPQLVMAYFEDPDHDGHVYGPHSPETRQCITRLDVLMKELWEGIQTLPYKDKVNLIVTSDHGMTEVSPERILPVASRLKPEWYERIDGDLPAMIYAREGCQDSIFRALQGMRHGRVWKKQDIPADLHFGSNARVGDVIVVPDLGWLATDQFKSHPGTHGFDPEYSDMQVIFRAQGPDFKQGYEARSFRNVCIYPLLAHLLGIQPASVDGNLDEIRDMLAR